MERHSCLRGFSVMKNEPSVTCDHKNINENVMEKYTVSYQSAQPPRSCLNWERFPEPKTFLPKHQDHRKALFLVPSHFHKPATLELSRAVAWAYLKAHVSLSSVSVCGHAGEEEEMGTGRKKAASGVIFNQSFLSPGSLSQRLNTVLKGVTEVGCSFLNQQNVYAFFPPARLGCVFISQTPSDSLVHSTWALFLGKEQHKSFLAPDVRSAGFHSLFCDS